MKTEAMTDDEMRVKIAEACGWKCKVKNLMNYQGELEYWTLAERTVAGAWNLPDYINDLNAMHEAEKTLTFEQQNRYGMFLMNIGIRFEWHATARQRAESFLAVHGP